MRLRKVEDGLTVNGIAGTHVVWFGFDLAEAKRPGFRGFALRRYDAEYGETIWLRGMKTFASIEPVPARGEDFRTVDHPIQGFQWADYSAKPGRTYVYAIVARYGLPGQLETRIEVEMPMTTEVETGPTHSAFFNRGSTATQEYARRFENKPPDTAGPGAYEWLSRGLLEALVAFLGRAGAGWDVHGAVYEFQWPAALAAVKAAKNRGAKVHVLYDDIVKENAPYQKNRDAIADAQIKSVCKGRALGKLMHNKFFVLSQNGQPKAVWTGSTNLTENGIYGHSNVGHIVEDETIAQAFLDYWRRLEDDPKVEKPYRDANVAVIATPPVPWDAETIAVFSPRQTNLDALKWYADIAKSAQDGLFMTFAFGMNKLFKGVYRTDDAILRMALMERAYSSPQTKEQDEIDIQHIRNRRNVLVAIGNHIPVNAFDRWVKEWKDTGKHVYWVHTKYMIVDPLGDSPIVVGGSANFSDASTKDNDENMLIIRGDKRIADIYWSEYARLYTHYAFRESVKFYLETQGTSNPDEWKPQFLDESPECVWMDPYFDPTDRLARDTRRKYFSGPMAV